MSQRPGDPPPRGTRDMKVRVGAFELTKRGAARYDWRDPYHIMVGLSWPHFLLAVLGIDLLLNLFFGALYALDPAAIANLPHGSYADAVFFSIETLATVGYGVMAPQTLYGHLVASVEIFVGMGFTAITTGLLFVRIARPQPRILFARNAVITTHNGRPALMLRVGNGRATNLIGAQAELGVLLAERTSEGQQFRRIYELPLERPRIPIFALTWTLIHHIEDGSPLFGYDAASLRRDFARLFLSIEARDPVLAATVHDMQDYGAVDMLFGHRFADAVMVDGDGRVTADLTRLHDTEPEAGQETEAGLA